MLRDPLPLDCLEPYLRQHLPGELTAGPLTVDQFLGGHANLTYLLRFGTTELVLRRPPHGKIAPGAHDMRREFRVLSRLPSHFAPAPRALHLCTDEDVLGADFIVMERRHGVVIRYHLPEEFRGIDRAEIRLTDALIDTAANLHRVDVTAAGLSELGKPKGFNERQLRGWKKRWQLAKTADSPSMDDLWQTLERDVPAPQATSIVHGDYKFDNCQFQPGAPDRVTSVFDWDMATLGDPLFDLACTLAYWPDPAIEASEMPIPLLVGGWPDKAYLRDRYAAHTGFDLRRVPWYEALAAAKTATIAQQLYRRYREGNSRDARQQKFGAAARAFAELAWAGVGGRGKRQTGRTT